MNTAPLHATDNITQPSSVRLRVPMPRTPRDSPPDTAHRAASPAIPRPEIDAPGYKPDAERNCIRATHFGRIASALQVKGTPIGGFDTMIAAHAASLKLVLVTNNTKHVTRIPHLKRTNWT